MCFSLLIEPTARYKCYGYTINRLCNKPVLHETLKTDMQIVEYCQALFDFELQLIWLNTQAKKKYITWYDVTAVIDHALTYSHLFDYLIKRNPDNPIRFNS